MAYESPSYTVPNRVPLPVSGTVLWGLDLSANEFKPLQLAAGAITTITPLATKILAGRAFSASQIFESVSSGSSVVVSFTNPEGSGKTVSIVAIEVASFGQAHIRVYRNPTVSGGTPVTTINLNMASDNTPVCSVLHSVSWSGGELAHQTVLPGGSHIRAVGNLAEVGESVIIPPNYSILVELTNKSASAVDASIRFIWTEE